MILKTKTLNLYLILILLLFSTMIFFVGFHNVDLSYNLCLVANDYHLNYFDWHDKTINGRVISYTDGYRYGMLYMVIAFILLNSFIIYHMVHRNEKK